MKKFKPEHTKFIREVAKGTPHADAYKKAYPHVKDYRTANTNANRLLKNADISAAIEQERKKINNLAAKKTADSISQEQQADVLTVAKKREILRQIAEGEMKIQVHKPMWDSQQKKYVAVPVLETPDHNARMNAIRLDNMMAGDNAPVKQDIKSGGKPITNDTVVNINFESMPLELLEQIGNYFEDEEDPDRE